MLLRSTWPALCVSLLVHLAQVTGQAGDDAGRRPEVSQDGHTGYAACRMRPSGGLDVKFARIYGHVLFQQEYPEGALKVLVYVSGFPVVSSGVNGSENGPDLRAIHIHQFGDIGEGCGGTGGHYNPHGVSHPSHPGDFDNFAVQDGMIMEERQYTNVTLFGPLSVIGRAVVLHHKTDDMGQGGDALSVLNGNAGHRLACCVIGISSDTLWKKYV